MSRIINQVLDYHLGIGLYGIHPDMKLEDIGADSLDCIEICIDLEEKLTIKISDEELNKLSTVQDVYDICDLKLKEKPSNSHLLEDKK